MTRSGTRRMGSLKALLGGGGSPLSATASFSLFALACAHDKTHIF